MSGPSNHQGVAGGTKAVEGRDRESVVVLGRTPLPPRAAAKAAVMSLSEAFRIELAGSHPNIRVVVVYPGRIATDFGQNALGQRIVDIEKLPARVGNAHKYNKTERLDPPAEPEE